MALRQQTKPNLRENGASKMKTKHERGILLSAPIAFEGDEFSIESSNIDPAELRRSALFWDKLVWPDSKIFSLGSSDDEDLLQAERVLSRPSPTQHNDAAGVGDKPAIIDLINVYSAHSKTRRFCSEMMRKLSVT